VARLSDPNGADALVAWNASVQTAIIVWQGSEERIDWLQDIIFLPSGTQRAGGHWIDQHTCGEGLEGGCWADWLRLPAAACPLHHHPPTPRQTVLLSADDFRPGNLSDLIPGVRVHRGFLNQFEALTTKADSGGRRLHRSSFKGDRCCFSNPTPCPVPVLAHYVLSLWGCLPAEANNITAALLKLSGGQAPQRVISAGHSLGAALR
jgi:hypothetical protein